MGHHMYNHSLPANKSSSLNRHSEWFFIRILIVVLHCFGQSKYSLFLYLKNAKKLFFPTDLFTLFSAPAMKWSGHIMLPCSVIPSFLQHLLSDHYLNNCWTHSQIDPIYCKRFRHSRLFRQLCTNTCMCVIGICRSSSNLVSLSDRFTALKLNFQE